MCLKLFSEAGRGKKKKDHLISWLMEKQNYMKRLNGATVIQAVEIESRDKVIGINLNELLGRQDLFTFAFEPANDIV